MAGYVIKDLEEYPQPLLKSLREITKNTLDNAIIENGTYVVKDDKVFESRSRVSLVSTIDIWEYMLDASKASLEGCVIGTNRALKYAAYLCITKIQLHNVSIDISWKLGCSPASMRVGKQEPVVVRRSLRI